MTWNLANRKETGTLRNLTLRVELVLNSQGQGIDAFEICQEVKQAVIDSIYEWLDDGSKAAIKVSVDTEQ